MMNLTNVTFVPIAALKRLESHLKSVTFYLKYFLILFEQFLNTFRAISKYTYVHTYIIADS